MGLIDISEAHLLKQQPSRPKLPVASSKKNQYGTAKAIAGAAISGAAGALLFKDGTSTGLHRVGSVATAISNVISSGLSIAFPLNLLKNEQEHLYGLTNPNATKDDSIFGKMVNTAVSLGYMPVTFSEPLVNATKSNAHLAATIMNLPHILFSLFAYTGGRFFSLLKFVERKQAKGDHEKEYRIDQEFNALWRLGNLGSAQATIIPMSSQFIMGWENIKDIFTGNIGDAWQRIKENPISGTMGTLFNSWMFIPEWFSKCLDTSVRIAEGVDTYQNALSKDPENSATVRALREFRNWWHDTTADKNSMLGKALTQGRELSKITALIVPPVGMISVVLPTMNKFLRGEVFNKEAQEIGGLTAGLDKVTSIAGLAMHLRYTLAYGAFVRVPQFITTSTFYGTSLLNKIKGKKPGDAGYVDPNQVKDSIFNNKFITRLSEWAEKKIEQCDDDLGLKGDDRYLAKLSDGSTKCRQLRNYAETMLEESWEPVREARYDQVLQANGRKKDNSVWKDYIEEVSTIIDGKIVGSQLLEESLDRMRDYLKKSYLFDEKQMNYVEDHEDWVETENTILKAINAEYQSLTRLGGEKKDVEVSTINGAEIPKSFLGLFRNPKALLETIKLKGTIRRFFGLLPFRVKGFVDIVDFGKETDDWWYRNYKAQITGIKEADVNVACNEELFPVTAFGFQSAGKGFALIRNLLFDRQKFAENIFAGETAY